MNVIGKEAFLSANDRKQVFVPLDKELYGNDAGFFIRVMSGRERSEIEKMFVDGDPKADPGNFRATVLIAAVVDESGKAVFDKSDKDRLLDKNAGTLEMLFEKACEINGFTKKDVERLEKN